MDLFTTKIKLVLLACAAVSAVAGAAYWYSLKRKNAMLHNSKKMIINVPHDRVKKKVLDNGMHVLAFKNDLLPKVLVQVAYDVGSYVEDSGERGLAHLVEHMIFKGTNVLSESDIDTIARKYGATFNAFTAWDTTSYYFEIDKNNWKHFLPILSDCMQNARFDPQHLASEVKAVVQELKMGKDNFFRLILYKACELGFPPNHPYHTPVIGYKEDLLNLTADRVKAFYKKHYRPDRATLFIVGDVDPDQAIAEAEKTFASLQAEKSSNTTVFPELHPELLSHHTKLFEDIQGGHLGLYWVVPGTKAEVEHIATCVEAILAAGESARLPHLLVDEKQVASSVTARVIKFMEAGLFLIVVQPVEGKTEECVALIRAELEKIMRDGVSQTEIERIAKVKTKGFFHKLQDNSNFVMDWITSYQATGDEMNVFARPGKFYAITQQQVQDFTRAFLDPFAMHRIDILPLPESKKALRADLKKQSDMLDQKILGHHVRTEPIEPPRAALTYPAPNSVDFTFPKPERIVTLDNGLQVLLCPRKNSPLISLSMTFKDSDYLESAKDGVLVDLMMGMLIEGSEKRDKQGNVACFEQYGASYSFAAQGAFFSSLSQDFEHIAHDFLNILTQPTFPKKSFEKVRAIFIDQYQRAKDSPKAVALQLLTNQIYRNHPYAWTFDEAVSIFEKATTQTLTHLHKQYINGKNMVLSVVGDFDNDTMERFIKQNFNALPQGDAIVVPTVPPTTEKIKDAIDFPMLRDQMIFLLGRPSALTMFHPDLIPLKLLNIICFGSMGSRIYKVREETGLFYGATGTFAAHATKQHGYDYMYMLISPENAPVAHTKIKEMLQDVGQNGITAPELEAARILYLKNLIDAVSDYTAIGRTINALYSRELGFDYYDKVLERIQTITVDELNTIAKKYCTDGGWCRVRVGRIDQIKIA
jgi:zinc protease